MAESKTLKAAKSLLQPIYLKARVSGEKEMANYTRTFVAPNPCFPFVFGFVAVNRKGIGLQVAGSLMQPFSKQNLYKSGR